MTRSSKPKTPTTQSISDLSKTPPKDNLTDKQRAFVNAYMTNGFNATQAAITAGYSEDSARVIGHQNLTKLSIRTEVQRLMAEFIMPAEEVLSRLTEHARGDLGDVWDETTGRVDWEAARALGKTGIIKRLKSKTTRISRGVGDNAEEVETFEDEIELHNPQVALQLLGKYHGHFGDKLKIDIHVTWQDEAVSLIKSGEITYEAALETFDHDDRLVRELFAKAQVEVSTGQSQTS
jgi:phage terminase small subunit